MINSKVAANSPKAVIYAALIALVALSGCSAQLVAQNNERDQLLVTGDYAALATSLEAKMGLKPSEKEADKGSEPVVTFNPQYVLEHLEAAEAWRLSGRVDRALAHFDAAESSLTGVDNQGAVEGAGRQAGAVLVNDTMLTYRPSPAEAVLINYYKAISFMSMRDRENARVELNRADDRIRRAVEHYEKEIGAAQEQAQESGAANAVVSNADVASEIRGKFPEMSQWEQYPNFVVPSATYLQGLFLAQSRDRADIQKARDLLGRVVGITDSPVAARDLEELGKGRLCPGNNCVWIIAECGQGPQLVERRFDLPLPTKEGLITLSMALPTLESRLQSAQGACQVSGAGQALELSELSNMDRVIQTEFSKRFPAIVTRSVVSAAVKGVAQHELNKKAGPIAGLIGNIAAAASTAADTRMWRSLPGRIMVARLDRPADGTVLVAFNGGVEKVSLPADSPSIVHIKQLTPANKPSVSVLEF